MNWKIVGSSISGGGLLATLVALSFLVGDSHVAISLNLAVLVFGLSAGWVCGIFVSPYSEAEESRFSALSKAVAALGAGYLVGKLDRLIEMLFDPGLVLESVHGFRLLAGLSGFAVAVVITFVYRQYARVQGQIVFRTDDPDCVRRSPWMGRHRVTVGRRGSRGRLVPTQRFELRTSPFQGSAHPKMSAGVQLAFTRS